MSKYSDEIKAVYAYVNRLMHEHNLIIYKVVHGDCLDLYYGPNGDIWVSIENSISISHHYHSLRFPDPDGGWMLDASIDLGDPQCFEKFNSALKRAL
jgi:hypothetical protein